ncbi:MAG: M20/M25/M40 family metallo-hydrolase [Ferruginibacter sp.]
MKKILIVFTLIYQTSFAQNKKSNDPVLKSIKANVEYLASDKLEGRRTGTAGEKLAYDYIEKKFKQAGLKAAGDNGTFIQAFEVNDGKKLTKDTKFSVNGVPLKLYEDWFPLSFSKTGSFVYTFSKTAKYKVTLLQVDLAAAMEESKTNPHFNLDDYLQTAIKEAAKDGIEAVVFYNSSATEDGLQYDAKAKLEVASVPAVYVKYPVYKIFFEENNEDKTIKIVVSSGLSKRTGHNVIGYINNNAASTIVLGAHYDHLGYGEDKNSLYTGHTPMIHNGADDNASGTAALIELAQWANDKKVEYKKHNFLFIAFSGEELGLYGSKYFTENPTVDLKSISYMINMDMLGRLNDSTHSITIGGYGTSPTWGERINEHDKFFKIKIDSSGSGPSDHTSFYRKDIPVLFFFTGTHSDYHKPSDDANKINYKGIRSIVTYIQSIIATTDNKNKLVFTKTREANMGKSSFKVSMGIMPDYTFSGNGVLVDGVSENRPAEKAGVKTGDVIIQLGEHNVSDVQTYMQALNKFNKGQSTKVKLLRGKEELTLDLTF